MSAGRACGSPRAVRRCRCAMADELGDRGPARRACGRSTWRAVASRRLGGGERMGAEAVVCALPVGPLRDVAVTGVSAARLA